MRRVASVMAAAILGANVVLHAQPTNADLLQFLQQYEAAYNKGDVQGLVALHAQDVLRLGSDGRALAGRADLEKDIAASLAGPYKGTKAALHLGRTQVLKPDVVLMEGTFERTGGSTHVRGRYLLTLTRENGQWRIASLATAVAPPAASK